MCPKPILLILLLILPTHAQEKLEAPKLPSGEEAHLFAAEPLIKHPIGICIDQHDRLLVVESHTHFRPEGYEGPEGDRILWLRDMDGDGTADDSVVLLEDLQNACLIKQHPNGWLYITTRSEVLRIQDADGDGEPEAVERRLAWLETEGNHPHNGISGLAFDEAGNLFVGMGENLGADYILHGSDGSSVADGGEGGNIWFMTATGAKVRRFATGFWNPFGMDMDGQGNLFASDNDPGSSPPSRLHRVIDGGDYGFLYRYGRSGHHPFVALDGELPGTIPAITGVGEAPCDLLAWDGDGFTDVLVTSWVDHWVELHRFGHQPGSVSKRAILLQGGRDFRPVSLAVGPDGKSLFVSDWVKRSYQLHGYGRIWRFPIQEPQLIPTENPSLAKIPQIRLDQVREFDPWAETALIERLRTNLDELRSHSFAETEDPAARAVLLLAWRRTEEANRLEALEAGLQDPHPVVRLLALKWIADEQRVAYKDQVDAILRTEQDPDLFYAALTTRARFEDSTLNDRILSDMLRERVLDPELPPSIRLAALRVFPQPESNWKAKDLAPLLNHQDLALRSHALRLMTQLSDLGKKQILQEFRDDNTQPETLRRFALAGLPNLPLEDTSQDRSPDRPPLDSFPHPWLDWAKALPGEADPENGRFVFYHPSLGGCAVCHQVDGIGRSGGPDLSRIGEMSDEHIVASILNPSIEVAPQYQPWMIQTTDGRTLTGFQLAENGGTHTYADIAGNEFVLKIEEIESRQQLEGSLMPPGLFAKLSDNQVRDLIAFLATLYD